MDTHADPFYTRISKLLLTPDSQSRTEYTKGQELNSAATLTSQPAAGHTLSFIISIVIMTLACGLFVGLAVEICGRTWFPCLD